MSKYGMIEWKGNGLAFRTGKGMSSSESPLLRWEELAAEVATLREQVSVLSDTVAGLRADRITLRKQLAEAKADAERWRWSVTNARWIRHEHEAYVAIPVAVDADLSCVAARVRAVDAALTPTEPSK